MARDPCILSTQPTAIAPARPAIAHVQLRDLLVCPRETGVVNYVVEKGLVEQDVHLPRQPTRILARLAFTPNSLTSLNVGDDTLLAAGGQDKEIHLSYYTASSSSSSTSESAARPPRTRNRTRLVWEFEDHLSGSINNSILLTPAHQSSVEPRVAISNNDGSIKMYDVPLRVQSSRRKLALVGEVRLDVPINHSSISPDGRTLLSVGDSSKVYLHQITGGSSRISFTPIQTLLIPPPTPTPSRSSHFLFSGHGNSSNSLAASFSTAFSGDGSKFAVASQEGVVAVWDVRCTGRPMKAWYTDKSRGGVGGGIGIPSEGGGLYSAGNGVGAPMNGGASGWLTHLAMLSPPMSAASSPTNSPGSPPAGTVPYLSDDPWEWTKGTKAPGWCVRSVKFNAGEGARMGREVMAFTEHTSLVHIVDARTFETHDVIRVPTLFDPPPGSSSAASARAAAALLRGKRRSNKGIARDGDVGARGGGGVIRRRRRRPTPLEESSQRERPSLPISHARSTPSTGNAIAGGSMDVDPVASTSAASSSALPVSVNANVNANASGSRSRSRPRTARATTARQRTGASTLASSSGIGNISTNAGGINRRNTPNPFSLSDIHPQQPRTGISVVQALGDAFRIALPASAHSSTRTGNSTTSTGVGSTAPTTVTTTPRYSPPASIGDSTWRTLGRAGGPPGGGVQAASATATASTEPYVTTFRFGSGNGNGATSASAAATAAPTTMMGGSSDIATSTSTSITSTSPPTATASASEQGERRRRGNVNISANANADTNARPVIDERAVQMVIDRSSIAEDINANPNLWAWARMAIEEFGSAGGSLLNAAATRDREREERERANQQGDDEGDYLRRERDDARRRVRMRMMREEEEEEEEVEEAGEDGRGGAQVQAQEEEGIVVVPDLGDRDVESEVHAVLTVHGIPSRLGGMHHGHGQREYEVDEQNNGETEEDEEEDGEEDGMDIDVQELDNDDRDNDEDEDEEEYHGYHPHDGDEDEEMYDDEELYDDDLAEHDHDEDDEIDIFDVECPSGSGSRTASPGPGQRRIRQGTVAEDAAMGAYDTYIGGRHAVSMGGGASTSMRYGPGGRMSSSPSGSGSSPPTLRNQLQTDTRKSPPSEGGSSWAGTGVSKYGGRRFGYHDDLDLAGLCFDPCGERMYVLNLLPSPFGRAGGGGEIGWGMGMGMGDGETGGGGGLVAGAVVEWSVRGAEKRWWVDESWM